MDLAKLGISSAAFTQAGQLVFVHNVDGRFNHQPYLRAYLRLFDTDREVPLQLRLSDNHQCIPVLRGFPEQRRIKWLVGLTADARDNIVVYWDDTVVHDWEKTGLTAEFKWQPTSEVVDDIPKKNVEDHIAWFEPLLKTLRRAWREDKLDNVPVSRANYPEDRSWGPDVIE